MKLLYTHLLIQETRDIFIFHIPHLHSNPKHVSICLLLTISIVITLFVSIIFHLIFIIASYLIIFFYDTIFKPIFIPLFKTQFGSYPSMLKTLHFALKRKIYSPFLRLHHLHYLNIYYFSSQGHYYCNSNNNIIKYFLN